MAGVLVGQVEPARGGAPLRTPVTPGSNDSSSRRPPAGRAARAGGATLHREVIAHQQRPEHLGVGHVLDVFQHAVLPPDHPPFPDADEAPDGVIAVARVADHVGVAGAGDLDRRRRVGAVEPLQRVAQFAAPARSPGARWRRSSGRAPWRARPPSCRRGSRGPRRSSRGRTPRSCQPTQGALHRPMW